MFAQRPARRGVLQIERFEPRQSTVPIAQIRPNPRQPRRTFDPDRMEELKASIRAQGGLLQSIRLWQLDEDCYEIIAGERRWRAYSELAAEPPSDAHNPADYQRIPAVITELHGPDKEARTIVQAIAENVIREDLTDGDKARALLELRESTGWTWESIGERLGLAVGRVQEMAAWGKHEPVRLALDAGTLRQRQATTLGRLPDPDLATALIPIVAPLDDVTTTATVREARTLDSGLPAEERARRAVAAATAVRSTPPLTRVDEIPVRRNGRVVSTVHSTRILLANTALSAVKPRVREMGEEAYDEMLREACAERGLVVAPSDPPSETATD